ncbi:MAG: AAA domain-containing protein [Nitrosospira sp.]
MNEAELKALYASNQQLTLADEIELSQPLLNMNELWSPDEFLRYAKEFSDLIVSDLAHRNELWNREKPDHCELELLLEHVSRAVEDIGRTETETWRLAVIQAGMEGGQVAEIWRILCHEVEAVREQASKAAESLFRYSSQLANCCGLEEQRDVLQEIIRHLNQGKTISPIKLLLNSKWKKLIEVWRVDGNKPARLEHFQALLYLTELELARGVLVGYWARQIRPHGAPDLNQTTGLKPEEFAFQFVSQIRSALDWHTQAWLPLENSLIEQGLLWIALSNEAPPAQTQHHRAERLRFVVREMLPDVIAAETRRRRLEYLKASFCKLEVDLQCKDRVVNSVSRILRDLKRAVEAKAVDDYRRAYFRLEQLHQLLPVYQERMAWLKMVHVTAPDWADAVERRLPPHDGITMPGLLLPAWRWRQFTQELDRRAALSVTEIQARIKRLGDELRVVTVNLVEQRAWAALLGKVNDMQRQALLGWAATMKKIGVGTGRNVPALMRQARREMEQACGAVPVWIMPFNQVTKSFHPVRDHFDVLIVDEASQEDVLGLIPFYMAKKVIVVGDDEQVTPLDVGGEQQPVQDLIGQWLEGLPSALLFDLKTSIYDRAQIAFGSVIRLKEHFRCVPEIIQFSNHLSYKGEIRPLRESASTPVKPALVAYRVNGNKVGKKNPIEAECIANLIVNAIEQSKYAGKTFGVISLVGDEQADEIDKMLRTRLDPVVYKTRRILCGNPAQFQGDERDVIFLSMVDSKEEGEGPLGLRQDGQDGMWKKRYNVAVSRAKDQLWVIYSLDHQTQLKPGDLRRRLIEHALNPDALMRLLAEGVANTESPFEAEVYRLLVAQGYQVHPQWEVGAYRIDLVVEGSDDRLAVECDGERWHYDKVEEDLARQALLERLGWKFVRIRGSVFYRDRNPSRKDAMRPVFERLRQIGILPVRNALAGSMSPLVSIIANVPPYLDDGIALMELAKKAASVYPDTQIELRNTYSNDDFVQAIEGYTKAADQGHDKERARLKNMCRIREGMPPGGASSPPELSEVVTRISPAETLQPINDQQLESHSLAIGQNVLHPKFGQGVVLSYHETSGYQASSSPTVKVNFATVGEKLLSLAHARLKVMGNNEYPTNKPDHSPQLYSDS